MTHRATEERFQINRPVKSYVCPKCGETAKVAVMWTAPMVGCDNCGTEMRPVEPKLEIVHG